MKSKASVAGTGRDGRVTKGDMLGRLASDARTDDILKAVADTDHPLLAHIIPIRRCNLACTYCYEYGEDKIVDTEKGRLVQRLSRKQRSNSPARKGRTILPETLFCSRDN